MGGMFSGRRASSTATRTVDDCHTLDVRAMQKDGSLAPNQTYNRYWHYPGRRSETLRVHTERDYLICSVLAQDADESMLCVEYKVQLNWTSCGLGGERPWFICPTPRCRKRVAILYRPPFLACRHCYRLGYPCQQEDELARIIRKGEKIRRNLGWQPGIYSDPGSRPKGMHNNRFYTLKERYEELSQAARLKRVEEIIKQEDYMDSYMDRFIW